ncbi:hypothetical protein J4Q44_G00389210, partial [Coregonus suidteri]
MSGLRRTEVSGYVWSEKDRGVRLCLVWGGQRCQAMSGLRRTEVSGYVWSEKDRGVR